MLDLINCQINHSTQIDYSKKYPLSFKPLASSKKDPCNQLGQFGKIRIIVMSFDLTIFQLYYTTIGEPFKKCIN
jgi:hypothetical protein